MDIASKVFYALLTLLFFGLSGWGLTTAGPQGAIFGLFAFLTIGGCMVCIFEQSIVRSAFSLMATFGGVAGLFLMLGASFLAMAQILIYVGGILALILFGVMLSPPDLGERDLKRVIPTGAIVGGAFAWIAFRVGSTMGSWATMDELPEMTSHAREIGIGFLHPQGYLVAFELAAYLLTVALVAAVYVARRKKADLEPLPVIVGSAGGAS
ncbi:MAG: NADH-quinone oxidoreductase subunit J [Chlamydiales bacterium]|jgi:NADH-quinone oxidoreductase subunit J